MAPSTISNDTTSVPVAPVKTIQAANGSNGTNGNSVSAVKESNFAKEITNQTVLNAKFDVFMKTELVGHTEARKFDCVKHVRPAQFPEALGVLPFPQELRGLVAWTDAFVERLGWAALQAEQKTASKEISLGRSNQEIERLNLRVQELQTKLHNSVGDNHKLKGEVSHLTSRNRSLEEQHKWDSEQIESFNKTIAEKQTTIWGLTKDNEKQRASVNRLVERVKKLISQHKGDKHLIDAFEDWKSADKIHDEEVDKLVDALKKEVETQTAATKEAEKKAEIAAAGVKVLEAENARLVTMEAQLAERVKSISEQLKKLEGEFGASEGQKATLEALLCELKKKEANAQIEIQSLHQKLHDAKESVEAAKEQVLAANEHANSHWETLQTIRIDGGWLRTDERDVCDVRMAPFICKLPVSQTQPITDIQNPFN